MMRKSAALIRPLKGQATIISTDDDQESLFSERVADRLSQASTQHGIEWR